MNSTDIALGMTIIWEYKICNRLFTDNDNNLGGCKRLSNASWRSQRLKKGQRWSWVWQQDPLKHTQCAEQILKTRSKGALWVSTFSLALALCLLQSASVPRTTLTEHSLIRLRALLSTFSHFNAFFTIFGTLQNFQTLVGTLGHFLFSQRSFYELDRVAIKSAKRLQ